MITYEVEDRELQAGLNRLRSKLSTMRRVYDEIGQTLLNSVEENFKKESSRGALYPQGRGSAWKDLAPGTIQQRRKKGKYPGRKLQVTGQLLASIQANTSSSGVIVGTNKKYATFLQQGTKRMPPRPFLVVQMEDFKEIQQIVTDHLKKP